MHTFRSEESRRVAAVALALVTSLVAPSAPAQSGAMINEICYDEEGVDRAEFVELHNRSARAVEISAWSLGAEDALGETSRFLIPKATLLAPGAFYVIGSAAVPGVDLVVGSTDIWPNSQHALILRDASGRIVDAVDYESWQSSWRASTLGGEGLWPEFQSASANPSSWQRIRDGALGPGSRSFHIRPRTPGRSNVLPARELRERFDAYSLGSIVPAFSGSFARPRVIDPSTVSVYNPSRLPRSPQGGRAAVFWDPQGGGNACFFEADAVQDSVIETYVWIDARPLALSDRAAWSIGIRGGTGSFYDFSNVSGSRAQDVKNGNTGISWTYEATDQGATLYLVDHGDGAWGSGARTRPRVLRAIPLRVGVDDGWQRLRLEARGGEVEAFFGGRYLCADGVRVRAAVPITQGGVYFAYRERIALPSMRRPLTCDRLRISANRARREFFGKGQPTSFGIPRLETAVPALAGRGDFELLADGLVPNGTNVLLFGLTRFVRPVDLADFGARPQTWIYVNPLTLTPGVADASGRRATSFPLPCVPELLTAPLYFQVLDFDFRLNLAFPVGTSRELGLSVDR